MLVAKRKRRENIAEYILYLWQIEDLLRALSFDSDRIYSTLVAPHDVDENKKQEIFFWYMSIVNLLKEEKKELSGHNHHSLHLIRQLDDLHSYLLKNDAKYAALHNMSAGDIDDFRERNGNLRANEIEICFDALYAKLLLNMKREPVSEATAAAFERMTAVVAYLAAKFKRFEEGEETYREVEN